MERACIHPISWNECVFTRSHGEEASPRERGVGTERLHGGEDSLNSTGEGARGKRSVPLMEGKQIRQLMKILHKVIAKSEEIVIPLS